MGEKQLGRAVSRQWEPDPDFFGQVVVGELHFVAEDGLGRLTVLGDDPAPLIAIEQGVIQPQQRDQGGKPKLPGLEDQVAIPQPQDEPALRSVWPERQNHRLIGVIVLAVVAFDHDLVQAPTEQAPFRISQAALQLRRIARQWRKRQVRSDGDGLCHGQSRSPSSGRGKERAWLGLS